MTAATTLDSAVWAALGTVIDPELDEPITDLGFVSSCTVEGGAAEVHLRLPTSFCAPNFAYLMAADSQDALRAVPGVETVRVYLDDHHDSDKINAGLAATSGYVGTFPGEAEDSLDELRRTFQRKAFTAATERACSRLLDESALGVAGLHRAVLADVPEGKEKTALLQRRQAIGLDINPESLLMVDDDGTPVPPAGIPLRLRFARTVRVSMDGNAHFCRGLLRTRYPESRGGQAPRAQD